MVNAVSFPRCSVFEGLPTALHDVVDELMDNRHSASSQRTVKGALVHWDNARAAHGWPRVIPTDDPCRGGKLATFVSFMVLQTDLVYSSIKTYVWGLRVWVKSQRHVDPVLGVFDWDDFMLGVHVKAWQPSEPRKAIPLALLRRAIMAADVNSFQDVQMVLLILILLFTFARSETPCPTTLWEVLMTPNICLLKILPCDRLVGSTRRRFASNALNRINASSALKPQGIRIGHA
jgi:hypothetical protein